MKMTSKVVNKVAEIATGKHKKYSMNSHEVKLIETEIDRLKDQIANLPQNSNFQAKAPIFQKIIDLRERMDSIKEDGIIKRHFDISFDPLEA